MKNLIHPLTCLAVLLANIARCDELPFFSSIRAEIVSQVAIATNNVPVDKKLVSGLGANLKLIDRTKPTFITGSAALGTLAKGLGRTSLSNTFHPLLMETRAVYLNAMETQAGNLEYRLSGAIPGTARTAGRSALDKLAAAIEGVTTNASFSASLSSLSKAAKALVTAEKSVVKAELAVPGADFLTATITESAQGVTPFKPAQNTILDATYDPYSGEIDIDASDLKNLGGGRVQVRFMSLTAIVPGDGTYTLSLTNANEGYVFYERGIVFNINAPYPDVEFQETYPTIDPINHRLGSGTLTVTLDTDANIVWGEFNFSAKGVQNANAEVSITGSFLLRLEIFE